jgi:hypothetical protein
MITESISSVKLKIRIDLAPIGLPVLSSRRGASSTVPSASTRLPVP